MSHFPALYHSRGLGYRAGWPSCSHRPASIDPSTAHSIACVAFASTSETLVVALRGSAPRGASRDGPPAPRRLGQPSPCTTPISDVLRRHRGHCLAGSRTGGKLARRAPCDACRVFTRATETAITPRLAARYRDNRDAFRRVSIDRVAPAAEPTSALLFDCARSFAHRSRLGAAASCVSTLVRRAPRPAPCRRLALRLLVRHDARCVRPTSAFSRSSYEHPRLVGSRCVMRLRACAIEEIACFTSVRFASVGHTFVVLSPRWALSSRRDACDPYLWHPCRLSHPCQVARATCAPVEAAETALDPIA